MPEISMPLREHEFQVEVIRGLTELKAEMRAITERLDRLNGSVARHEKRLGEAEINLTSHAGTCPLHARVGAIECDMASERSENRATEKATTVWHRRLAPVVYLALAFFAGLVLSHAGEMMKLLAK